MKREITLYNGVKVPTIALGTWQIPDGKDCYDSVMYALKAGYRHIDTAAAYGNERSVGQAIKDSKIDRKEVFITTKLPAEIKDYEMAKKYFNDSLANLGVDYIDLYLIHAPWPWNEIGKDCRKENIEIWKAFIEFYNQKKVRAIGVSNFHPFEIDYLVEATNFVPMANQILFFIGNRQQETYDYCMKHNIAIEAYSPLATGRILGNELLQKLADKYNCSVAKICLAYCLQKGTIILPKSTHQERIEANFNVDIILSKEDMDYLDSLDELTYKKKGRS